MQPVPLVAMGTCACYKSFVIEAWFDFVLLHEMYIHLCTVTKVSQKLCEHRNTHINWHVFWPESRPTGHMYFLLIICFVLLLYLYIDFYMSFHISLDIFPCITLLPYAPTKNAWHKSAVARATNAIGSVMLWRHSCGFPSSPRGFPSSVAELRGVFVGRVETGPKRSSISLKDLTNLSPQ